MRRWKAPNSNNNNYNHFYYNGSGGGSPGSPNNNNNTHTHGNNHQHQGHHASTGGGHINHPSLSHQHAFHYGNNDTFVLKCTDLPQYDACMAHATMFQNDDKLHLRNLCNDTARCASLMTIHTPSKYSTYYNGSQYAPQFKRLVHHKIILDYSHQRVTGETMEQLFDLADAVGLRDRTDAMYSGKRINITNDTPVLHHVLRMPPFYDYDVITEVLSSSSAASAIARTSINSSTTSVTSSTNNNTTTTTNVSPTAPANASSATAVALGGSSSMPPPPLISAQAQRALSDATASSSVTSSSSPGHPTSPPTSASAISTNNNNINTATITAPISPLRNNTTVGNSSSNLLGSPISPLATMNNSTSNLTAAINNISPNPRGGSSSSSFMANDPVRAVLQLSTSNSSATSLNNNSTKQRTGGGTYLHGYAILKQVNEYRTKIQEFVYRVRNGEYSSIVSHDVAITNFLVVGNGDCTIGPQAVAHALSSNKEAIEAAGPYRQIRFVSNIDPVDIYTQTKDWKASKTLIILTSMNFTPGDPIILLARTVQTWLLNDIRFCHKNDPAVCNITDEEIISRHMIAITGNTDRCNISFPEIDTIFTVPSWVNTRFSLFSPIGLVPLALQYSYPIIQEVMEGAHDMDEHFFQAPLRDNIPVILGLLGVWNSTFLGCSCRAIIPYSQALSYFPSYVQYIDLAGNGKRVAMDGTQLLHRSGEITFGGAASTCLYTFFQSLHQGRVVPADFIGFMESPKEIELPTEAVSNHDELMSNFFAQPDALAYGKTLVDLIQEGTPEPLREHMVFTGNRPSSSILMTRLDAFSIGQLIALYEHRSAVQGFIWGINSFDSFGNELGTTLAKHVRAQLSASRKTDAPVQGFNGSTSTLLEYYLAHGKVQQQRQQQEEQPSQQEGELLHPQHETNRASF